MANVTSSKKALSVFVIAFLLVAQLPLSGGCVVFDREIFSGALQTQSNILQYASLSVLPLKIIDSLLNQGNNYASHPEKNRRQSKREKEPVHASAVSLAAGEKNANPYKALLNFAATDLGVITLLNMVSRHNARRIPCSEAGGIMLLLLIMLLSLSRPRSDTADISSIIPRKRTQSGFMLIGFFLCQGAAQ